jgi:hypothetical protein
MPWKVAILLTVAGLPGVIAIAWLALPLMVDESTAAAPLATLQIASMVQGALFVATAALIGTRLAEQVGLHAPVLSALLAGERATGILRTQLLSGAIGGLLGAVIIIAFHGFAPPELTALQSDVPIPIVARVLYGGITEEILVRWGLMTFLVWLAWRVLQRGRGTPATFVIWVAIGFSAIMFGVSHLPSVAASSVSLTAPIALYITFGNALFGLVAGWLFWRKGLEAAIIAHSLAHVLAFAIRG